MSGGLGAGGGSGRWGADHHCGSVGGDPHCGVVGGNIIAAVEGGRGRGKFCIDSYLLPCFLKGIKLITFVFIHISYPRFFCCPFPARAKWVLFISCFFFLGRGGVHPPRLFVFTCFFFFTHTRYPTYQSSQSSKVRIDVSLLRLPAAMNLSV